MQDPMTRFEVKIRQPTISYLCVTPIQAYLQAGFLGMPLCLNYSELTMVDLGALGENGVMHALKQVFAELKLE